MKRWAPIRDIALFVFGLAGIAHETLIARAERPSLLLLFAAMLGLPAFFPDPRGADGEAPPSDRAPAPGADRRRGT